jgi:hypothetical protein
VVVFDVDDVTWATVGPGPPAAALVGVEAEVVDQVLARLGHVLGDFGDEVQGIEDPKVAGHAAEEVGTGRAGEPTAGSFLGQVENLVLKEPIGSSSRPTTAFVPG